MSLRLAPLFFCLLGIVVLDACRENPEPPAKPKRTSVRAVKVEIGTDGLAHLPGSTTPFTGDAIEIHKDRLPHTIAKRTPYLNGLKNGAVTTFSPGGKVKEERTFKNGKPFSSVVYHGNGKKKIEVLLNDKNLAEGPYHRWHDNGVLESECNFDADEHFHGEEKTYNREGKLIGQYRHERGKLVEILFETPEMKEERLKKMAPPPATPAPASVKK